MTDIFHIKKYKDRDRGLLLWLVLLTIQMATVTLAVSYLRNSDFECSFEKSTCRWFWNVTRRPRYRVTSGEDAFKRFNETGQYSGPFTDADNKTTGHYLHLKIPSGTGEIQIWSTKLYKTQRQCTLRFWANMVNMTNGKILAVAEALHPWVLAEMNGNDRNEWEPIEVLIGRVRQEFYLLIAVEADGETYPAHVSIDRIELVNCFEESPKPGYCKNEYFTCNPSSSDYCLNRTQLCDLKLDCLNKADENLGCDAVPAIGRCTFEGDWCGWRNSPDAKVNWTARTGIVGPRRTGPESDRMYNHTTTFLYANMSTASVKFGEMAMLDSSAFNPPPLYHSRPTSAHYLSCTVRFFYHQYGYMTGSFSLYLIEHRPQGDHVVRLFYSYGDHGDQWSRAVATIPPNIRHKYHLQFEVRRGVRGADIALDDFTLSPECFGLNVPEKDKEGYDYNTFKGFPEPPLQRETHSAFVNKTVYTFTTCGSTGRTGPTPEKCMREYNNTNVEVTVVEDSPIKGVQKWVAPETHFYTIIAKGASGGSGPENWDTSKGASAMGIIKLVKGEELYMLVGQEGNGGCRRDFAMTRNSSCVRFIPPKPTPPGPRYSPPRPKNPLHELKQILTYTGGGGGGGTFVYRIGKYGRRPLIIGAGGGGLGLENEKGESGENGKGTDPTRSGLTGMQYGKNSPGAGGGWDSSKRYTGDVTGASLQDGATGGHGCGVPKGYHGMGGFGGGGGGCTSGGGGGGYSGGSASSHWKSGRGGYSYVSFHMRNREVLEGSNDGPGSVIIIPAVKGCNCEYLCAAVDEYQEYAKCICPNGEILDGNSPTCMGYESTDPPPTQPPSGQLVIRQEFVYGFLVLVALSMICLIGQMAYKCYKRAKRLRDIRRRVLEPAAVQPTADIEMQTMPPAEEEMVTQQNPTYEAAGPEFSGLLERDKDIPVIPRELLTFERPIGHGAFGEVYRGYYKENDEAEPMPVAIKTLPSFASTQGESDFYMEALIMSKFDHPNVVRFIGVCYFDRHPRFIVIELMPGGDLKRFLMEHRPHSREPDRLTMRDLLQFARDVALGCAYLEERKFIHRDIAARNCLLTSVGEDRRVKIADFGMAKNIYRAEYYRKVGRALIPVKWMPPEAFQDGIFTTKTDIWSYGVFLWEVFTLGFMPYSNYDNLQVMQFVVRGGRLERPQNCPRPMYDLMRLCWEMMPEDRPTFGYIIDCIEQCLQDRNILNTRLPLFPRSSRRMLRLEEATGARVGERERLPPRTPSPKDDDQAGHDADDEEEVNAPAADQQQITYAETVFDDAESGSSKSTSGKNSISDSTTTVFVVPEPMNRENPLQGLTGWCKRGKAKSFDFTRRWSLSDIITTDRGPLEQESPPTSARREPQGPKGRLKSTEIKKHDLNIETVGRDDKEDPESGDSDMSTYC